MFGKMMMLMALVMVGFSVIVSSTPITTTAATIQKKDTAEVARLATDEDSVADASADYDESDMFLETPDDVRQSPSMRSSLPSDGNGEVQDHSIELEGGSQTFFPAFANLFQPRQPLGHSRPQSSLNQEGAYSQRPNALRQLLNYQAPSYNAFRSNDFGKSISSSASDANGLLGSGNFGVIRGGTFFSESSDTESQFSDSFDSPYYNNNNGHGRPTFFFGQNNPRPNYNQDQFANFRDFADINVPSNSAYSHFVVVYANKNGTISSAPTDGAEEESKQRHLATGPKNIMERLAQIEEEQSTLPTEEPMKKNKTSKAKAKLALISEKKHGKIVKKMLSKSDLTDKSEVDPLLALS